MRAAFLLATAFFGLAASLFASDAPRFTTPPTIEKRGDGWTIRFAVDRPTDIAVAIVDHGGMIVRHLTAGRLDAKALAQQLPWDGTDDAGKPLKGGEYRVRVSLGLRPRLDGFIGQQPGAVESVRALAIGPKGEVFVFHVYGALHPSDGSLCCTVFNRAGEYRRTILPPPGDLADEKMAGWRRVTRSDGRRVPFLFQAETRSFLPGSGDLPPHRAVCLRDGRVAFVGIQEWVGTALRYSQPGTAQLVMLGNDGSAAADGMLKTTLSDRSETAPSLAISPDERTFYATGLLAPGNPPKPVHAVYAFSLDDARPRMFAGNPAENGASAERLDRPMSVAVDAKGRVYVADKGNDRIAVFDAGGKPVGALNVDRPERVEVDRRSGAVYVLGGERVNQLARYADWKAEKPSAQIELPSFKHPRYTAVMALDDNASPPVLWVGTPMGHYARFRLLRIEAGEDGFGKPVETIPTLSGVDAVTDVSVDRRSGTLYTGSKGTLGPFYDGVTGKRLPLELPRLGGSGNVATFGADGKFYVFHQYPSAAIARYSADLKRLPFAHGAKITNLGSPRVRGRGLTADHDGNIYVLYQKSKDRQQPGDAQDANALAVYGPDGTLKHEALIDSQVRQLASVRVDAAGNIYLAIGVRPSDRLVPDEFARLERGARWKYGMNATGLDWYPLLYGSIVQFGPKGGAIRAGDGGLSVRYGYDNETALHGAKWLHFGASVPSWRTKGTPDVCLCESPRFDVDGFGRVFFPDAGRFSIGMLDSAGNELGAFGEYGNVDAAASTEDAKPSIPLCWPQAVAVDDRFVYIADRLNRRVVRVRLEYAAEETLPLASKSP